MGGGRRRGGARARRGAEDSGRSWKGVKIVTDGTVGQPRGGVPDGAEGQGGRGD